MRRAERTAEGESQREQGWWRLRKVGICGTEAKVDVAQVMVAALANMCRN